ncbi:response regulator [Variovorax sp. PvP013]|uniref:response regulator n=1 Tax=Variovorax sp. PvP013 TaxID=3156435 RepID=UPI003D24F7F7
MLNVYLVDDDRHVVNAMTELLEDLPDVHVVGHAQSEGDAVDWLLENRSKWHLAIVDLALGPGNGLQVLSACRVRQSNQKVVVLSNHLNAAARRRCAAMGADAAFMKDLEIGLILKYCSAAARS